MGRRILWTVLALGGVGLPVALLSVVHLGHGAAGAISLFVLVGPPAIVATAYDSGGRVLRVIVAALALAAWSTVAYAAWQWSLFAAEVRNLIRMQDHGRILEQYQQEHGSFPERLAQAASQAPRSFEGFGMDEWRNPFFYESRKGSFVLVSFGRDEAPDGRDYWADRKAPAFENTCGNWSADQVMSERGFHRACGK